MADLTFSMTIGVTSGSKTIAPTNTRALEFLDDLIVHFGEVIEGDGPMTREQVAQHYLDQLMQGQINFAKGLKQRRLDATVTEADDLEGNTD